MLLDTIKQQLRTQGPMPFAHFMHQALYTPNLGYYSSSMPKFGTPGDFITAPELNPLFGAALAASCLPILKSVNHPTLFEFGAGRGRLCVDILTHLEKQDCLPETYVILEVSAQLKTTQQALIQQHIPHLASRVQWLSQWPNHAFEGVVLANEVLDAMPVHRFLKTQQDIFEGYVTLNEQDELTEIFLPCTNLRLRTYVDENVPLEGEAYQSEVNLFIDDWLQQSFTMLDRGMLLMLDYGFPRHEYYHPDRDHGTLMCHHRHTAHTNPFMHVGEQDITAHVDFTHVAEAGFKAGFHVAGYTNQASFLLGCGLLELCMAMDNEHERIMAQQAIKTLIQPHEMGELFKVMALTKNIDLDVHGFQLHDKRASLG